MKLKTLGVSKDDIVAISSSNCLECCVPVVATLFLGAKITCFSSKLSLLFVTQVIQLTEPKFIFADMDAVKTISSEYKNSYSFDFTFICYWNSEAIELAEVQTKMVVFGRCKSAMPFSCFTVPMAEEKSFQPVEIDSVEDTALIIYTHGSTGLPMGTCISHQAVLHQAMHFKYLAKNYT